MSFETNKILGTIGALLIVFETISVAIGNYIYGLDRYGVPDYGIIIIVGIICILISLYNLANFYQAKKIFTNAFLGAVSSIIAIVIGVYAVLSAASPKLYLSTTTSEAYGASLLCILIVCLIVAAFFVRHSLLELANQSGTNEFAIAGQIITGGTAFFIISIIVTFLMSLLVSYNIMGIVGVFASFGVIAIVVTCLTLAIGFAKTKKN